MSIAIDRMKCKGCGACANVCPGSLIEMKGQKAGIVYPKDCWGCSSCIKECAFGAISLYLGADIGGMGSRMSVTSRGSLLDWQIHKRDGSTEIITINKKDSNKY